MADYNSLDYKRSRASYMAQCTIEYFVSLLVTDAFLAKLLTHIGISDSLIGIISSFITMAFVIQLASIALVRLKVSTKKLVITFDTLSIFFFMALYIIPFLPIGKTMKTILVVISVLMAYAGKYLIYSIGYKWANSFVEPHKRARYSANKEIISLILGMGFTALIGYIIDRYEGLGNLEGGFIFIAVSILILNVCNFISLSLIKKEDESEHDLERVSFGDVIKNTFKNRNFRNIIILTIMWDVGRYFTMGFVGVYKTNDLALSVFLIQVVNIAASGIRALVSVPIGAYSDRTTFAKGFRLGVILTAIGYLALVFTTKTTWWLIIVFTVFTYCGTAGTNQNSFNIAYSYVDSRYISQAMAIKNSIGGVLGFFASVAGGRVVSVIQGNGNTVFGFAINAQQFLAGISFIIFIAAIVFMNTVVVKEKVMKQ